MDEGWLRRAIAVKRDGGAVDEATWHRIVGDYLAGAIDDAPVAALLMACAIRGMVDAEIAALTDAMIGSGDIVRFAPGPPVIDKHSSGGVGDAVSLVVVPLVAACGVRVAKLSGRALGHTGGTLDKLEAVAGVRTDLDPAAFSAQVDRIGCAIAAQSARLVPADQRIYALRDRTASVPSRGLIAASIVSKKIAAGADGIVFDVKSGGGALLRDDGEALELARTLVALAEGHGRRASALVTDMDQPLASTIGTGIELAEARDLLRGRADNPRLSEVVRAVAGEMLRVAGRTPAEAAEQLETALASGAAAVRLVALIEAQGGSRAALDALDARPQRPVIADCDGVVTALDTVALGEYGRALSRGRPDGGIRLEVTVGERVRAGERLATFAGDGVDAATIAAAFALGATPPPQRPLVLAVVRDASDAAPSNAGGS